MITKLKSYLIIFIGLTLTAISSGLFYIPNEIVTGGISGLATILYTLKIPPGIVYLLVNLLLLLLSAKILGKRFVITSLISIVVLSVLVQFFSVIPPATNDKFLASLFGSIIFGIGAALTFSENANTGGTDILGRLIQSKYQYFPIGTLLLIIDGVIIIVSLFVFKNIDLALYGLFGLLISTFTINYLIDKLNSSKLAFVITEKGIEISDKIVNKGKRGVTILNARGAYSKSRKNLLICALKNREMPDFYKMINDIDSNAFIIFTKTEKIFGLGFYVYK